MDTRTKKRVAKEVLSAKEEILRGYELVVIITAEADAEEVEATLDHIEDIITRKGGAIDEVVMWGKRKLAYPINHAAEGNYALIRFKANPSANRELTKNMRISEKLLRYLLVKTDED